MDNQSYIIELLQKNLRPGKRVDLVLERDDDSGYLLVRPCTLHQCRERFVVLNQTEPPLSSQWLGRQIEITFLVPCDDRFGPVRVGYKSALEDRVGYKTPLLRIFTPDKNEADQPSFLVMALPDDLSTLSLRMHLRVPFGRGVAVDAKITPENGPDINAVVMDLSAGGAKLLHLDGYSWPPDYPLTFKLNWLEQQIAIKAQVVRQGAIEQSPKLAFTAVRFEELDIERTKVLRGLLSNIRMQQRREQRVDSGPFNGDQLLA